MSTEMKTRLAAIAFFAVALSAAAACGGSQSSPTPTATTPTAPTAPSTPSLVQNQFAIIKTGDFRVPVVAEDVNGNVYAPFSDNRACPYLSASVAPGWAQDRGSV